MAEDPQSEHQGPVTGPAIRRERSSAHVFFVSVWAFLLREMKNQFGQSRLGYFWAVAEPGAVVAILTTLHAFIRGNHATLYGENPVVFFVFGAVPYFLFMNSVTNAQGVCSSHKGLFNYRQVKPIDVILARCLIEALTMTGVGILFLVGWWWIGKDLELDSALGLAAAMFALFLLGTSTGLAFEVFGTIFPDMKRIFGVIMRPMFFISGLFFTIDMIPVEYRAYLVWNPVLHGVDFARDAVLVGYTSPGSVVYLVGTIAVLLFVSLSAYRRYLFQLI
ncbi:ABC transporter permease [Algiphilus aromaticivorans]|jgi:capsular polysaccharide transport system permease protein|uniref:ABC transporter permease n=1 Tax=Algiphilus aromaticivorans TaxID=382454 RepID=UPI0005C22A57|nr:ABC transporter permease [Algiphilus aromaticivorans]